MSTIQNDDMDTVQPHCFEPFPEPQTIPSGWDLSTLLSTTEVDSAMDEVDSADNESR